LVLFVVLGVLLFGVHAAFAEETRVDGEVVVDQEWARGVEAGLGRSLGRAPTSEELASALRTAVDEELLYREGLALGLDRGDPIVRRRLIQRTRFLHEDRAALGQASDEELAAYLAEHGERYRSPLRIGITHAFAATERHADPEAEAARLLAESDAGEPLENLGDPFSHGRAVGLRSLAQLDALFGAGFSKGLADVELGAAIVASSSYGWHAVRVDDRQPPALPELARIRARVERDWSEERREEAARSGLRRLYEDVELRIELDDPQLRAAFGEGPP